MASRTLATVSSMMARKQHARKPPVWVQKCTFTFRAVHPPCNPRQDSLHLMHSQDVYSWIVDIRPQ